MPPSGGLRTSLSWTMSSGGPLSAAFQTPGTMFGPGIPMVPVDPQPIRVNDYRVGTNTIITPRSNEPVGFAQLRAFANVELVRLAIETRKDQIERMDWSIKVRNPRKARSDSEERIRRVEKFWRKPDGVTPFATWLRKSLEDVMVLDAPAFEMRRTRGGQLNGLDIVPGDTVKILVDETGRIPLSPAPAYQQVIHGRPWVNLTTRDLLYVPRNPRPHKLYGYGNVEQIIVTVNTVLQRQASQLFHFGIGNVPAGILTAPDQWTPDQILQYQDYFDSRLSGNIGEKQKVVWVPSKTEYHAFKEPPLKDDFDEWLSRIVCYCFSLPVTPFIKAMNRASAEQADQTALEEGREPLLRWWKRIADGINADELDCPDLVWSWEPADDIDPSTQSKIDDIRLRNGSATINQIRLRNGEDPYDSGGDTPRIYVANGALSLDAIDNAEITGLLGARVDNNPQKAIGGANPSSRTAGRKRKPKATVASSK
jgi:hypothetical protein